MQAYLIRSLMILVLITGCGNQPPPIFTDIPLYPAAQHVAYGTSYGENTLMFTITGSVDNLKRWYTEQLGQRGWIPYIVPSGQYKAQFQETLTFDLLQPRESTLGRSLNIHMNPAGTTVDVLMEVGTYGGPNIDREP